MTDRWKVTVDPRVCVRTGLCAASAPKEFQLDENGQGRATAGVLPASEEVLEVAESCPIEAISITDADTGEAVFPPQ
ncbi:ferredoxin [Streptomyces sp. NPDC000941]|jgi:ferredoxin|uniref:ferredoxin n=1 Tax=Streptomyces sp. NBS 14/10 TaxID=1945643 RepID=UPI000B7CEB3F|nr:ferredoxin [Streptomyces sp. NBS 14/10]KAK1185379.1 ferredoxin [Streptomyces sp. NBS 14/10]NUS90422.1 ferredoxin [Streptomyces sp.]